MLPDDVYRDLLERTLVELEAWANAIGDCAGVDIAASQHYWRIAVAQKIEGACPFELMIKADQTFTLKLAGEVYEDKPIDRFDFFLKLIDAVAAGRVERIETRNAQTGVRLAIATRVELADGWDWIGERRVTPQRMPALEADEERRAHRFLPYRR
jgi:hypothetical protein